MHQIKCPWNRVRPRLFRSELILGFKHFDKIFTGLSPERALHKRTEPPELAQVYFGSWRLFETRVRNPIPSSSTNVLHNQDRSNLSGRVMIYEVLSELFIILTHKIFRISIKKSKKFYFNSCGKSDQLIVNLNFAKNG